jgi:8-oxo-dGTP pyrophosphatase MutT (NUDIX family)
MKSRRQKLLSQPIMAAGGIVMTAGRSPLIAVVQRRKDDGWVLPKGKLKPHETALAAAQREAMEETGHRVAAHEYLGVVSYESGDRPKIVQFWRMASLGEARREPMRDIKTVKWLPLDAAIARLTQPVERAFLAHIGQRSVRLARLSAPAKTAGRFKLRKPRKPHQFHLEPGRNPRPDQPLPTDALEGPTRAPSFLRRLLLRLHEPKPELSAHDGASLN